MGDKEQMKIIHKFDWLPWQVKIDLLLILILTPTLTLTLTLNPISTPYSNGSSLMHSYRKQNLAPDGGSCDLTVVLHLCRVK